jgi:hypothetical protein
MLGEIGLAIREIERGSTDLPESARLGLAQALSEVHKVWPEL